MNDDVVDEDTGEVIPIIRIFIKNFIVSVGSKEEYEEHEYFYDRIQQGDLLSEQCPESFISPGHCWRFGILYTFGYESPIQSIEFLSVFFITTMA